jgi:hypothetical protein
MVMSEMRMMLDKLTAGKEPIPMFFDPKDLAQGSYGVHVDKYLGRSPSDGPAGYIFQKVTYSAGAVASKASVAGMYKVAPDHQGYIYHDADGDPSSAELTTEVRINGDGADLAGAADPTPAGISGEAKLVPGDMILGAILQLIDTRGADNRTGFVTAGLVSNDSATPDAYGPDLAADPSNFITGSAISGGKTHAAYGLQACSVASPNLNIYSPTIVATAASDLSPAAIGAPINAINVSGISGTTSNQLRFVLNVYALVGARQKTISHYTQPDPSFKMDCLTRQFAEHPVSMMH